MNNTNMVVIAGKIIIVGAIVQTVPFGDLK